MQESLFTSSAFPVEYLAFAAGLGLGGLIAALFFMRSRQKLALDNERMRAQIEAGDAARAAMDNHFKVSAAEAVKQAHESFLALASEKLGAAHKDSAHDLEKRQKAIDEMIRPVQEHLKTLGAAVEQAKGTDEALRADLKNLSRETARLVGALRDPAAQGRWGEYILEGLLDKSGLIKGVHYQTQVSIQSEDGLKKPDAVIDMQDGFKIIIDAKAPVNKFVEKLSTEITQDEYDALMRDLAVQVKARVKDLGKKNYWENIESPDFTVLFLPSEHIYSLALRADPALVDFAAQSNVIIASPTLLMSLLRVVGMSWRQTELAKNAAEISERGSELYKRLLIFTGHIEKIGKGLQGAMKSYDQAVGSLERQVLPSARKLNELQGGANKEALPDFSENLEQSPRLVNLTIEDEAEKKRA